MKTESKNIRDQRKTLTKAENSSSSLDFELASERGAADHLQGLGEPHQIVRGRTTIRHWSAEAAPDGNGYLFEDGDGILVARTASSTDGSYRAGLGQLLSLIQYSQSQLLKPREIIIMTGQPGVSAFRDRWDLNRIRDGIDSGLIGWFAFRSADRIARCPHLLNEALQLVDGAGADLHTVDGGGLLGPNEIAELRMKIELELLLPALR